MSFYSGTDGRLYLDGKAAAKVSNWSFSSSLDLLETTTLGDVDRTTVAGIRSTSGSCTLFYHADNPSDRTTNSASTLLNKIMKGSSSGQGAEAQQVKIKLYIKDGTTQGKYVEGSCWVTSASMTMAVGSILSADISFEFDGAPTTVYL